MDIEQIGVDTISEYLSYNKLITSDVKKGDRTPLEDGCIFIHKNDKKNKQNIRKVIVQSKGKSCIDTDEKEFIDSIKNNKIKFRINYETFQYFRKYGGVFFITYILKNRIHKLTYYILYPSTCKEMIDKMDNKKTKSINIKPTLFPLDEMHQYTLLSNIEINIGRQISSLSNELFYIDQFIDKGLFTKDINLTSFYTKNNNDDFFDRLRNLSKPEIPLYYKIKELPVAIPMVNATNKKVVPHMPTIDISINDKKYFDGKYIIEDGLEYIELTEGIKIPISTDKLELDKNKKENVTFQLSKRIGTLTKEVDFLINLKIYKEYKIGNQICTDVEISNNNDFWEYINYCKDICNHIERIEHNFRMNLSDVDLDNIKNMEDLSILSNMSANYDENKYKKYKEGNLYKFMFKIDDLKIITIASYDKPGSLKIFDIFQICLSLGDNSNNCMFLYPGFDTDDFLSENFIVSKNKLIQYITKIYDNFSLYSSKCKITYIIEISKEEYINKVNDFYRTSLLGGISSYDKSEKKYLDSLKDYITTLSEILYNNSNSDIDMINLLQVKFRLNTLDINDMTIIKNYLSSDNQSYKFCAHLLLGNKEDAKKAFNLIKLDERKEIKKMPIYNLLLNKNK